jgi:membrane protease YdiL (CAAX protease family)
VSLDSTPAASELNLETPEFSTEPPHISHPRIPEDIRVPWGWLDLLIFVLMMAFGLFVIFFVVVAAFTAAGVSYEVIRTHAREQGLFGIITQVILDGASVAFLAIWTRARYDAPFWHTIGWRKLETGILPRPLGYAGLMLAGASISLIVEQISNAYPPKSTPPIDAVFQDPRNALLFMIMAVAVAPLVEETIFRGFIYPIVAKSWGIGAGILVAGTLFGALHWSNLGSAPVQVGLIVLVGIIFTWVRSKAETVAASFCMHLGYNSFLFVGFLLSTHFLKTMPAN